MTTKLLIVDDSEIIRASLAKLIDSTPGLGPIAIHRAGTLAEALDCARRELPDFVILDFHLPDGNALRIIDSLKQAVPGTRIALFTHAAEKVYGSLCLAAGADWFFEKAADITGLLDVLRKQVAPNSEITTKEGHRQ